MKTLSYLAAKTVIASYSTARQVELDKAAAEALAKAQQECREIPLSCIAQNDALYPLAVVVSDGLTITPRTNPADGYPEQTLSQQAKDVLVSAHLAGIPVCDIFRAIGLTLTRHSSGLAASVNRVPAWQAACSTWTTATDYRQSQKHAEL